LALALACGGGRDAETEEVELAPFMGNLQRYSQKLGYSIQARNGPLAEFYLHEVGEVFEELEEKVPVHDGIPIAQNLQVTIRPRIEQLEESLEGSDWDRVDADYRQLIDGCNECHGISEHSFVHILPANGTSPFNQRFEP
jgi:hypothetical protein